MVDRRYYMRGEGLGAKLVSRINALSRMQIKTGETANVAAATAQEAAATVTTTSTTPVIRAISIPAQGIATSKDFVIPFYRTLPDANYTVEPPASSFGLSIATVVVKSKNTTSITITVTTLLALSGGLVIVTAHY